MGPNLGPHFSVESLFGCFKMAQVRLQTGKTSKKQGSKNEPMRGPVLGPVLDGFSLKTVGLKKAAKAIIHYKNSGFSVFIVFKMDIASSPLGGFVWSPECPPFGHPKPNNKFQRPAKSGFGPSQEGSGGHPRGTQKKSAKNRVDAGIRAADGFRHHWFWCPGRK